MEKSDIWGITQFLKDYPGMSIQPSRGEDFKIKGLFSFTASSPIGLEITDHFNLEISIKKDFSHNIPKVIEINNKIPRDGNFHVNTDGTLCLGSKLRVLKKINEEPCLSGFAESCLVPYLYAVSHKLRNGGDLIFGELAHGRRGTIDDYRDLFGLITDEQVVEVFRLLGMKKRIANKKSCPCNCSNRLGKCSFHYELNSYRKIAPRSWFINEVKDIIQ